MAFAIAVITGCQGEIAPEKKDFDAAPRPAAKLEPKAYTGDTLPPVSEQGPRTEGGTLRIGMASEPPHLNPQLDPVDARGRDIAYYVYESLAQADPRNWRPEPRLAESWEVSEDHRTFRFKLRRGVKWHDGKPFTADDVVFTFEKLRDPKVNATGMRGYVEPITKVIAEDPYTVVFETSQPYWFALDAITDIYIYPKHVFAAGDFNTHEANRAPVGTGRYKIVEWKSGDHLTLTKNKSYYGTPAHLDTLELIYVPDAAMRAQMIKNGELDVVERLAPEQWQELTKDAALADKFYRLRHVPDGIQWIGWNEAKPMFADARVRRAMTMLIDRDDIVRNLRLGLDVPAASWFYPGSPEHDATLTPWPYDPKGAAKLLAEAGWKDTNGNGTLDKDGVELAFTFLYPTNNPLYEQLAALITNEMRAAKIAVTSAKLEWSVYTERLRRHDFDACSLVWKLEPEGDPYPIWHSSSIGQGSNWVGFKNAKADELLEKARREFDREKRAAIYRRFSALLHDEEPITLLFNRYNLSMVSKKFGGVYSTPYGLFRYDDFYVVGPAR